MITQLPLPEREILKAPIRDLVPVNKLSIVAEKETQVSRQNLFDPTISTPAIDAATATPRVKRRYTKRRTVTRTPKAKALATTTTPERLKKNPALNHDVYQRLGTVLYLLRRIKNLSPAEVAYKMGVSPGSIYNFERGSQQVTLEKLKSFADVYEVAPEDLLRGVWER